MKPRALSTPWIPSCLVVLAVLLSGCSGSPAPATGGAAAPASDVDALIREVAAHVVAELAGESQRTVVVSYFTEDGQISAISETLIGDLTTTLANDGKGTLKVVSRQVLDRLLAEVAFQGSDLADPEGQIRLGRQLGADLVLTGFVTRQEEGRYRLNTQLVEVETGVVVTGLIRDFRAQGDLAERLAPESSDTVLVSRERLEVAGVGTVTTVFEDFDHGPPEVQLEHSENHWGDQVIAAAGTIEISPSGSADDSAHARYAFHARLGTDDLVASGGDSGLSFQAHAVLPEPIEGYEGVSLALRAEGATVAMLLLKQYREDGESWFGLQLALNQGEWQEHKIPFAAFEPADQGDRLDPNQGIVVTVDLPYADNWFAWGFRTGREVEAALAVDNLGYYRPKRPDDPRVVETFDDEIERLPWYGYLYGTSLYTMWQEETAGEVRTNPGIRGQRMRHERRDGDASGEGRYFSLQGVLDLTGRIEEFFADQQGIGIYLVSPMIGSPSGFAALTFYMKSDLLVSGQLELQDRASDVVYRYPVSITGFWSRVRVPFAAWMSQQGSLRDAIDAGNGPQQPRLLLSFEVPPGPLVDAGEGSVEFEVGLDDFVWEK